MNIFPNTASCLLLLAGLTLSATTACATPGRCVGIQTAGFNTGPGLVERSGGTTRALLNVDAQGIALRGYDPTSYFLDNKPLKGDPSLAHRYQGATYYFVDQAHKDAFEKNPSRYVPQFGGFCGYAASVDKVADVDPEVWQIVEGRLVLQYSPETYALFNEDLAASNDKAEQYWPGLSRSACK